MIRLFYKRYYAAPLATCVSAMSSIFMYMGVFSVIISAIALFSSTNPNEVSDGRIMLPVGVIMVALGSFGYKVGANKIAEAKYNKIMKLRGEVQSQHISATRADGHSLYIECPVCGTEVEITNACSKCGSRIWHVDPLYKKDIKEIQESNYMMSKLQQANNEHLEKAN